jgi:hypothetical protein
LPYSVTRRAHARKRRWSMNGTPEERHAARPPSGINMHEAAFRSYAVIMDSTDGDLIRDVRLDIDKAETRLRRYESRWCAMWNMPPLAQP